MTSSTINSSHGIQLNYTASQPFSTGVPRNQGSASGIQGFCRIESRNGNYGTSLAVWDHTVLPANRHKWTRPA